MEHLPEITILCPVWNRPEFLPLFLMNVKCQQYPHNKLKVLIDDDGTIPFISDLPEVQRQLNPIQITYMRNRERRSIGVKRNRLIKKCDTKIFAFMDSDDIYFPSYIYHSYMTMKKNKVACVGTDKMLFAMSQRNFDVHYIDCGNQVRQIHEASIVATKRWFKGSSGFATRGTGEGKNLFDNGRPDVAITDINQCMVCLQHGGNTVEKLQFANDDNKLNIELDDNLKNLLRSILGMPIPEEEEEDVEVITETI